MFKDTLTCHVKGVFMLSYWQTNQPTNKHVWKHNLLGGGKSDNDKDN